MRFTDVLAIALGQIRANKLRSFFTLLGIIVSVAFLVAVVAIIQGMNAYVRENIAGAVVGANSFQVRRTPLQLAPVSDNEMDRIRRRPRISLRDAEAVTAALPEARAISIQSGWPTPQADIVWRDKTLADVPIFGVTPSYQEVQDYRIAAGRPLTDVDIAQRQPVIVVGADIATKLFDNVEAVGRDVRILGERLTIVGVIRPKGRVLGQSFDAFALMPLPRFEMLYGRRSTTTISVKMNEAVDVAPAMARAEEAMITRPEGIILVTGPTGSGKTTTLYSILNHINSDAVNVMTLEDPVEYPMTLIRQTSVAEAAKLDFANGIRAMMRQDPDVILVGEIRDRETAEMAFRAAMTGHQVYSTLHTNSAVGAFPRLLDIGILPDILAGNIIGILAQRLVRRLCRTCRQSYDPDVRERRLLNLSPTEPAALYRAVGCEQCEYQGYRGRQAILELLKIDAAIDELVARRATAREILTAARAQGFKTLADDGVRLARAGTTSLDEVMRVVDLTDRMS